MGVIGLWKILDPAGRELNFDMYIVERYMLANCERLVTVGIDASIWINQLQYPSHAGGMHSQQGANPELRNFFYQFSKLLQLPVNPLFVFDGPGRPQEKRGVSVQMKEHWLTPLLCQLIDMFGYDHFTVPGEAEAELARLNKSGVIDAVATEDSDVFIFGAQTVIRGAGKACNIVTVFSAENIRDHPEVKLNSGGLFLMASLCGSDYSEGLKGCGAPTAHKLALCGFDSTMQDVVDNLDSEDTTFQVRMVTEMQQELRTNRSSILGRRYEALSQSLECGVPGLLTLDRYMHPVVTTCPIENHSMYHFGERGIDITQLSAFVSEKFQWDREVVLAKFKKHIMPGVVFRAMVRTSDVDNQFIFGLIPLRVHCIQQRTSSTDLTCCVAIEVNTASFNRAICPAQPSLTPQSSPPTKNGNPVARVPVLRCALDIFYHSGNYMRPGPSIVRRWASPTPESSRAEELRRLEAIQNARFALDSGSELEEL